MSEQSNGMGAAEAKRAKLVALVSQLQTGWNFIVDYHRARMRRNEACPVTGGEHCRLGRNYPPSPAQHMLCRGDFISLVGPDGDPAMLLLRDPSDRSHRLIGHTQDQPNGRAPRARVRDL